VLGVDEAGDHGVAEDRLVDAGFLVVDKVECRRMGITSYLVDEGGPDPD
jgi:hypothetical protein